MTRTSGDNGNGRPIVRVVHVGPDIDSFGGTQTVIRVLYEHKVGADTVALLPTWCGSSQRRNAQLTARAARAILRGDRTQVLHFHISNGGGWLREGPLLVLAKRRGFRVIATIHGYDFTEFARAHPHFVRAVISHADRVLCLSTDARDEAANLLGEPNRVSTITNPVAIDFDAPTPGSVPPVALFAGSIGLRKGVDVLVDAWQQIWTRGSTRGAASWGRSRTSLLRKCKAYPWSPPWRLRTCSSSYTPHGLWSFRRERRPCP